MRVTIFHMGRGGGERTAKLTNTSKGWRDGKGSSRIAAAEGGACEGGIQWKSLVAALLAVTARGGMFTAGW